MRIHEIRGLNDAELAKELEESRRELFNLRFRLATHQLTNHRELPKVRRKVAQVLTVMRERQLSLAREGVEE